MGRVGTWVRTHWFVLCCMAVAAVVAIVVRDQIFPNYSLNRDEPVYVLQARTLRAGHLTLPRYDDLRFFQPWLTGVVDGRIIFEFPPGWPALLALVSLLSGSVVPALPIVAALAVLAIYVLALEASGRRAVAGVSATVLVLTPMVIVQSGLLVSYMLTLTLGTFAGAALLRGARTARAVPLVVGGGLLGGVFLTRPFDALLWGLPFVVHVMLRAHTRGHAPSKALRPALRRAGWVAVGFLPPAMLMAAYNWTVTGSPVRFPIEAADPLNTFGFGERRIMRGTPVVQFSRHDALEALGDNFRQAPPWVLGSWVGIALALVGVYLARRRGETYVLLGLVLTFGVGYLFYWGLTLMGNGAPFSGPQYYMPMLVPVVVLAATTLVAVWRWKAWVGALLGIAVVAISVPPTVDRLEMNHDFSAQFDAVAAELEAFDANDALVFVPVQDPPILLTGPPTAINAPALDGDRVYAADLAPAMVDLAAGTDRTPYRVATEFADGPDGQVTTAAIRRLRILRAGALRVSVRIVNPTDAPLVTASFATSAGVETRVLDRASTRGARYESEWTVAAPGAPAPPGAVSLPAAKGFIDVTVRFADGEAARLPMEVAAMTRLRWAIRSQPGEITVVRPPRRFGAVSTDSFGRVLLETPSDGAVRGHIEAVAETVAPR